MRLGISVGFTIWVPSDSEILQAFYSPGLGVREPTGLRVFPVLPYIKPRNHSLLRLMI